MRSQTVILLCFTYIFLVKASVEEDYFYKELPSFLNSTQADYAYYPDEYNKQLPYDDEEKQYYFPIENGEADLDINALSSDNVVQCSSDKILIDVTKSQLNQFGPAMLASRWNSNDGQMLFLRGDETSSVIEECLLRLSSSNSSFSISISPPFEKCVTHLLKNTTDGSIIHRYVGTIWWSQVFSDMPLFMMPYKLKDFHCDFQQYHENGRESQFLVNESRWGSVDVKFWNSAPNRSIVPVPLRTPLKYAIGEVLYVTVELREVHSKKSVVYLEDCNASSGSNEQAVDVAIVRNGCSAENITFQHSVDRNGLGGIAQFSFEMFKLPGVSQMHIRCEVSFCEARCPPKCINNRRRRRSEEEEKFVRIGEIYLSQGPLVPIKRSGRQRAEGSERDGKESLENEKRLTKHNEMRSVFLPVALICTNLAILGLLGLASYSLARARAQSRLETSKERIWEVDIEKAHPSPSSKVELLSMMPSSETKTVRPVMKTFSQSHSFCNDSKCLFLKDIEERNHRIFKFGNSKSKSNKASQETLSTTCPTPFNSPPTSPPESSAVVVASDQVTIEVMREV